MKRTVLLPITALTAAAIALSGCSSAGPTTTTTTTTTTATTSRSGTSTSTVHNDADVAFATDMIPHHAQAIVMADMAATQATNATVKSLARAIELAQAPELREMSGWLKTWGRPVPSTSASMGDMQMSTGMMTAADMTALARTSGAAFDRLWVSMMITHHQGAITMAGMELGAGSNPDATTLARSIISSQNAQIRQMQTLLTRLPNA